MQVMPTIFWQRCGLATKNLWCCQRLTPASGCTRGCIRAFGRRRTGCSCRFCWRKGGVGTTFLSVQDAAELAAINRVLDIDMDVAMGDMASILDLNPKDSIMSLLPRADRIDERMLTGSVTVHGSKVHVLAQQGDLDPTMEINADDIYGIIGAAFKGYQYILIDCGTYLDDAVAMSLNVADIVVVVTEPTVVSVRDCYRRIQLLDQLGVEKERVRLVVNKYSNQSFVSEADIQRNLELVQESSQTIARP